VTLAVTAKAKEGVKTAPASRKQQFTITTRASAMSQRQTVHAPNAVANVVCVNAEQVGAAKRRTAGGEQHVARATGVGYVHKFRDWERSSNACERAEQYKHHNAGPAHNNRNGIA